MKMTPFWPATFLDWLNALNGTIVMIFTAATFMLGYLLYRHQVRMSKPPSDSHSMYPPSLGSSTGMGASVVTDDPIPAADVEVRPAGLDAAGNTDPS